MHETRAAEQAISGARDTLRNRKIACVTGMEITWTVAAQQAAKVIHITLIGRSSNESKRTRDKSVVPETGDTRNPTRGGIR